MGKLIDARSPEIDGYIRLLAAAEYAGNAEAGRLIGELASVGLTEKNIVAVTRALIELARSLKREWLSDALYQLIDAVMKAVKSPDDRYLLKDAITSMIWTSDLVQNPPVALIQEIESAAGRVSDYDSALSALKYVTALLEEHRTEK